MGKYCEICQGEHLAKKPDRKKALALAKKIRLSMEQQD